MTEEFSAAPALVVCAHGTDDPDGRHAVLRIVEQAAARLPGVTVSAAYVDVQRPALRDEVDALVASGHRVVVVPLLLSVGHHTEVDVAAAVDRHPDHVVSTGPLGPHELLIDALVERLREAGAKVTQPVVLGVAGSSRPAAVSIAEVAAGLLSDRWVGPVTVGFLAAAQPRVDDAVRAAGLSGEPVAVASYLIGRGFFQNRLRAAGGTPTSEPLAAHPRLIDVVVEQYQAGVAALAIGAAA